MASSESLDPARMVTIYAAPDPVSAQMIRVLLESEGIFSVIGEQVTEYSFGLVAGGGYWGKVCVRAGDRERAEAILEAAWEGRRRVSDEELEAAAAESYDPEV